MSYVPDPTDVTKPVPSDSVGSVTPAEIRALKQHIIDKVVELTALINAAGTSVIGEFAAVKTGIATAIETLADDVSVAMIGHTTNTSNPHNDTKASIGLGLLNNYSISSAVDSASTTTYASSAAVKTLADLVSTLTNSVTANTAATNTLVATEKDIRDNATKYANASAALAAAPVGALTFTKITGGSQTNPFGKPFLLLLALNAQSSVNNGIRYVNTGEWFEIPAGTLGAYALYQI